MREDTSNIKSLSQGDMVNSWQRRKKIHRPSDSPLAAELPQCASWYYWVSALKDSRPDFRGS